MLSRRWRSIFFRLGFLAALAVTTVLCLRPSDWNPPPGVSDKVKHALAYGTITALALLGFRKRGAWLPLVLVITIWGVAVEFIQPHFGRSFELLDMAANTLGVAFSAVLLYRFSPENRGADV
ncbi:MAG: VanZ family protein [Verrucomicrobiales bacterium]|jgi:VanZ family protein